MRITVKQMIEQGGFADFQIYAGHAGLAVNEVKTVCVVDVPDINGWIFGGEFLLTSGYIFKDDPEMLAQVIESASKAGAAALGVKMERYIDRIPQNVLRTADRLSFPFIDIPLHYAHTEIINPVLVALSDKVTQLMHTTEDIHKQFLNKLILQEPFESILTLLNHYIGREILFVDIVTGMRYACTTSIEFNQLIENVPLASLIDHFTHQKIMIGEKTRGYLFLDKPLSDAKSEIALNKAIEAMQLYMTWEHERWKIERGKDMLFVQDILYQRFRQDSEILTRGRTLGWDLSGEKAVVLLGIDKEHSSQQKPHEPYIRGFETVRAMLSELQKEIPYTRLEDQMAFIIDARENEWGEIKTKLKEIFMNASRVIRAQTGLQIAMSIGSPVRNILSCSKSFREASKVFFVAQNNNASSPTFWEEMGIYKILAPIHDSPEAEDFIIEYLGALIKISKQQTKDSLLEMLF